MNIFVLDESPVTSAQMMCDKHIPKMIVESAQMLSTAHRMLDGQQISKPSKSGKRTVKGYVHPNRNLDATLYHAVHHYHPCTVWTMETKANYDWHFQHFLALSDEFVYRFGKKHLTAEKLSEVLKAAPINISDGGLTEFPQAMRAFPECMVEGNPIQAYRNYYHFTKHFAKWQRGRAAPYWWEGYKGVAT